MTTGKTIALTRWTFVGKVMSLGWRESWHQMWLQQRPQPLNTAEWSRGAWGCLLGIWSKLGQSQMAPGARERSKREVSLALGVKSRHETWKQPCSANQTEEQKKDVWQWEKRLKQLPRERRGSYPLLKPCRTPGLSWCPSQPLDGGCGPGCWFVFSERKLWAPWRLSLNYQHRPWSSQHPPL